MKKCPYCAEQIQNEAIVCRFCGRDLPQMPSAAGKPVIQPEPAPQKTSNTTTVILSGIGLLCGFCFCCALLSAFYSSIIGKTSGTSTPGSEAISQFTAEPSGPTELSTPSAIEPTASVQSTSTQELSSITELTSTPRVSIKCYEIKQDTSGMTDVQWEKYKSEIIGKWIVEWEGNITDVGDYSFLNGGYPIHIKTDDDCSLTVVVMDKEQALSYAKGQRLTVSGEISYLANIFGLVVNVKDETVIITTP